MMLQKEDKDRRSRKEDNQDREVEGKGEENSRGRVRLSN